MHISAVPDKTAHTLSTVELDEDVYHANIAAAARILYFRQDYVWTYVTQYSSGTTCWRNEHGETVLVSTDGIIHNRKMEQQVLDDRYKEDGTPLFRAPEMKRPPIAERVNGRWKSYSTRCTKLIERANKGEQGGLPDELPRAFVEDIAQWSVVFVHYQYGWEQDRTALNFQEDLADHWPAAWMLWLFQTIGYLKYTDGVI